MSKYKVLKDNLKSVIGEEFEKTLPIIADDYEDKIRRQAAEITRLLAENEKLKPRYENARAEGQNEAWELARKIFGMEIKDIEDIFIETGAWNLGTVLDNFTYQEAAEKVAEWEKAKEEIKVGDVYRGKVGNFVICGIDREEDYAKILWDDLSVGARKLDEIKEDFTKTGRHIDIDSFLKQIGGESDD